MAIVEDGAMKRRIMAIGLMACVLCASVAQAGTIWDAQITASGEGTANVLDGGPVVFASDSTTPGGPLDENVLSFSALDATEGPFTLRTRYVTAGEARFYPGLHDTLRLVMDFATVYSLDNRQESPRTGGRGDGMMEAVAEFVMPTDQLEWSLLFRSTRSTNRYTGTAFGRVENVTQGTVLFEELAPFAQPALTRITNQIISGRAGDLIRVTFQTQGLGTVEPTLVPFSGYSSILFQEFTPIIPEPSTLVMLLVGGVMVGCRFPRRTIRRAKA